MIVSPEVIHPHPPLLLGRRYDLQKVPDPTMEARRWIQQKCPRRNDIETDQCTLDNPFLIASILDTRALSHRI